MRAPPLTECPEHVKALLAALSIPLDSIAARSLVFHAEAVDLAVELAADVMDYAYMRQRLISWLLRMATTVGNTCSSLLQPMLGTP